MASVSMVEVGSGYLAPGASTTWTWNNPPFERVWSFSVAPSCILDYYGEQSWFTVAEITQVRWEHERVGWTGSFGNTPVYKRRIRITVRNAGGQPMNYTLFLSSVAP